MQQENKTMPAQRTQQQQQSTQMQAKAHLDLVNEHFTITELATEIARIIPYFATRQEKYKVSVYPDEATIRYYISQGFVDKPIGSRGNAAIFTRKHLLQVIVIKYLQSRHFTLQKIKDMTSGLDEKGLEDILFKDTSEALSWKTAPQQPAGDVSAGLRENIIEDWTKVQVNKCVQLHVKSECLPADENKRKVYLERLQARVNQFLAQQQKQLEESTDGIPDADLSKL